MDVSSKALDLLHRDFKDKQVVLVYENITHDGGDEIESDIYHVYIFTFEEDRMYYYTSSYEKRHVPSDRLVYTSVNGTHIDDTLPKCYLEGIANRVITYFQHDPAHPGVQQVLDELAQWMQSANDRT